MSEVYECPTCMTDLLRTARYCENCGLALPEDWVEARMLMLFGSAEPMPEWAKPQYVLACPLCDGEVEPESGNCLTCEVPGTRRVLEEGDGGA